MITIDNQLEPMTMKREAIVIDLDNTLALIGHRHPYDGHLCETDTVCHAVYRMVVAMAWGGVEVLLLTGRPEPTRHATEAWLQREAIPYAELYMRHDDDWSDSDVYKTRVIREEMLPHYDILFALDDDPKVVRAVRDMGIVCWHVTDWSEHYVRTGPEDRTDG